MNDMPDLADSIAIRIGKRFEKAIHDNAGDMTAAEAVELARTRLHLCVDVAAKEALGRHESFGRMVARQIDKDLKDLMDGDQ